jgi:hypothetical protein
MKCIKSVRASKNVEVGVINRINDIDAELKVKSGYWEYVPKSEYKKTNVTLKPVKTEVKVEKTISEKQRDSKKNKKSH